jgi:hypothetical protein
MASRPWKRLLASAEQFRSPGRFPIAAYSEFMPPPRFVQKPYGTEEPGPFSPDDPIGWQVSEYEEAFELRPGLEHLAAELLRSMEHLGHGRPAHGIAPARLEGNPFWPPELAERAGALGHERYVILSPLALSRTQDDKGRVRWTLFGGSEQGPARAFWEGFWTAPDRELPEEAACQFFCRLLRAAYGESAASPSDLRRAGFRILPGSGDCSLPYAEERLPSWTTPYLFAEGERLGRTKYLLTFRPFGQLPKNVRRAYLAGDLHLLPFPGSLLFWGAPRFLQLRHELPFAMQVPLLDLFPRRENPFGLRVPQAGWMHEPHPDHPTPDPNKGPYRNMFRRTHRWGRIHRHEDELAVADGEDHVAHVLFSTLPEDLGLYDKPMARNAQVWTHEFRLLLDGPRASREMILRAAAVLREGGLFGYRFLYPAMRVGQYEIYWHRPLVAYLTPKTSEPQLLADAPLGYLTAYDADRPNPAGAVELWPRLLARASHVAAVEAFWATPEHHEHRISRNNARKLLDAWELRGQRPLPPSFARALLNLPHQETLADWLNRLEGTANSPAAGRELAAELRRRIEPEPASGSGGPATIKLQRTGAGARRGPLTSPAHLPDALTYHRTARRSFEVAYWRTIAKLAHGKYVNKDNGDCVRDSVTLSALEHQHRDLEALGNYLLAYYERLIDRAGMAGRATVGDLPFHWQTDFSFPWLGGWLRNQQGEIEERDLMVVIPGRDRRRAVIMADHYDTAYMEDRYEKARGGNGARLAAAGADDNHSATAALMLGAPIFLELSRNGQLGCDVWLVHLTGEEFPSDCMGARHLAQTIVERSLKLRRGGRRGLDLSKVQIDGVYVLDMIAHNNDHDRDVFQISPGTGAQSLRLAEEAHVANMIWNANTLQWNRKPPRRAAGPAKRAADPHGAEKGTVPICRNGPEGASHKGGLSPFPIPPVARHPQLHGEVRTPMDPRSSLYNTDGQIFSDAGIPVVLFMENYDINRHGYHDTQDTMANIDLDYGAALAAITIEAVSRMAR